MTERRKTAAKGGQAAAKARRARGVAMLLAGTRHAEVAAACGVSTRQVERWATLPEVRGPAEAALAAAPATAREFLDVAAREAAEALIAIAREPASRVAVDGLLAIANDPKKDDAVRVRAFSAILAADTRMRPWLAVLDRTGHAATSRLEHTSPADGPGVRLEVAASPADEIEARRRAAALLARLAGGVELALVDLLEVEGLEWPAELRERVIAIARGDETLPPKGSSTPALRIARGAES